MHDFVECKRTGLPEYFPALSEGPVPIIQHWVLGANFLEVWLKDNPTSDHFMFIRKNTELETLLTFAAPDAVYCAWASEELGIEIAEKYFWACVGAFLFEQLHGEGYHIEEFLSWIVKKNFSELVRTPAPIST